jgi:hypothetical protein
MLRERVAQKPTIAVREGKKTDQNCPSRGSAGVELAGRGEHLAEAAGAWDIGPGDQREAHEDHEGRGECFEEADGFEAAVDDDELERPEEAKADKLCGVDAQDGERARGRRRRRGGGRGRTATRGGPPR